MSTSRRGFASMDPVRQREIASLGGRSIPPHKRYFSVNTDFAKEAGRKGGMAPRATKLSTPVVATLSAAESDA